MEMQINMSKLNVRSGVKILPFFAYCHVHRYVIVKINLYKIKKIAENSDFVENSSFIVAGFRVKHALKNTE